MNRNVRRLIDVVSSLKLTLVCLASAMILVFAGTMAQVHLGIDEVQARYFRSMFVLCDVGGVKTPVFPGGHLIGAVLLVNLITAHVRRFRWTWSKMGIHLTHLGLIIMLAGGLFTDLFAVESFIRLEPGQSKNYSEDTRHAELALVDTSDKELDTVTAIPEAVLARGGTIEHKSLPFRVVVRSYYPNARLEMLGDGGGQPAATQGMGARVKVTPLERVTASDARNEPAAVVEIVPMPAAGDATVAALGTWLVSEAAGVAQEFAADGKTWRLELRPARYYKDFTLTLQRFVHEKYTGTDIAANYASKVTLIDADKKENRDVLIYMNHPLRYRGDTFYQSGFDKGDTATILQTVHNPTFVTPYLACVIVATGLLMQFGFSFSGFARRRAATS